MHYQLIALDLDGTLTNSKKEITPPTLEALLKIQQMGKKVVLASGRPTNGILPLAEKLRLKEFGSYILAFNGGKIVECKTGKTIYNQILSASLFEPIYNIVKPYEEKGVNIITYSDTSIHCAGAANEYTLIEKWITSMPVIEEKDFVSSITFPINKFLITGEAASIQLIQKELQKTFHSYVNVFSSQPYFLEVTPKGVDKGSSLQKLLNSIGLTAEEMICCGDECNDLSMIEYAGLGVAMANAQSLVLQKADFITKSNDEDGVLYVINKFMLSD